MTYTTPAKTVDQWPSRECDGGPFGSDEPYSFSHAPSPNGPSRGRVADSCHSFNQGSVPVRYSDLPAPVGTRLFGLSGVGLVCLAIIGIALFEWASPQPVIVPTTLSVFDVAEPEAPPAPETEIPPGPEQQESKVQPAEIKQVELPLPLIRLPSEATQNLPVAEPAPDPGPPVERTTAPESRPAPPGSRTSDATPTWEGRVLAALNAAKRYPREARRNSQQGMPWVRFVMDREGRVRSVMLERSSGFDALDREALALPMRASPLPQPPDSVTGERVELVVPVEFFM